MATKKKSKLIFNAKPYQFEALRELPLEETDDYWGEDVQVLFSCEMEAEITCCGFPVIGQFDLGIEKPSEEEAEQIGKALVKWMGTKKYGHLFKKGYVAAYVPDTKGYDGIRRVLQAAGFTKQVSLKSNHGRYTNTRWEWYKPTKGKTSEKNLRTVPV